MTRIYLYPMARRIEMLSALFAGGYGVVIGGRHALDGLPPIGWTGLTEDAQVGAAVGLLVAALMHALGIRANGHLGWVSPALRLAGMLVHAAFFLFLTWAGGGSSASYTYLWVTGLLFLGCLNAARDTGNAWREEDPSWRVN